MGGNGSTRWSWYTKAAAVEDCLALDAGRLAREGHLRPGVWSPWLRLAWTNTFTGKETSSVGLDLDTRNEDDFRARVYYSRAGEEMSYHVRLETTRPNYGGLRWWFLCPLSGCGRRVLKLYLGPRANRFGCRKCHGLSYRSVQEHDSKVDYFMRHPEAAWAAVKARGPDPTLENSRAVFRSFTASIPAFEALMKMAKKNEKALRRRRA